MQFSRVDVVVQIRVQNGSQMVSEFRLFDREHQFNSPAEVAIHPVGAAEIDLIFTIVAEIENATVLKKSADYAANANVARDLGEPGAEREIPRIIRSIETPA